MSPAWLRMRIGLGRDAAPSWPDGVSLEPFDDALASRAHAVLVASFGGRADAPPAFAAWWQRLRTDPEYDPALIILANDAIGIVGVAQCWTSGFIKDLAVHPRGQRQGLGEALLNHVFALFRSRGLQSVELKVQVDNAGARRLYERVGMRPE